MVGTAWELSILLHLNPIITVTEMVYLQNQWGTTDMEQWHSEQYFLKNADA